MRNIAKQDPYHNKTRQQMQTPLPQNPTQSANQRSTNPPKPNSQRNQSSNILPYSSHQSRKNQQPVNPTVGRLNIHSHSNSNLSKAKSEQTSLSSDRVAQLHERLKNIHHFFKTRLEEQKGIMHQRNEAFMTIIEEMQRSHSEKVEALRKMAEEAEGQRKDVGVVDERMNEIKGSIDELLKQSEELKKKNDNLERKINDKAHSLRQKEEELERLKRELQEERDELQSFERLNLRENKRNKQITGMVDRARQATISLV